MVTRHFQGNWLSPSEGMGIETLEEDLSSLCLIIMKRKNNMGKGRHFRIGKRFELPEFTNPTASEQNDQSTGSLQRKVLKDVVIIFPVLTHCHVPSLVSPRFLCKI